jgi:hypothetical protein
MQAKGLNAASGAWQTVLNDLNAGTSVDGVLEQLKGLGIQSGVDSVSCAVSVWMHPANPAELNPYGVAAAKEWLLEHSTVTQD